MQISVYKKNDRSTTNEPKDENKQKLPERPIKEVKSSERNRNQIQFSTISKNSPFSNGYNNSTSSSKRK